MGPDRLSRNANKATNNQRNVTFQKSEDLIEAAVEAWIHAHFS